MDAGYVEKQQMESENGCWYWHPARVHRSVGTLSGAFDGIPIACSAV